MWAFSSCGARASHCGGFSCCGAGLLGTRASVPVAQAKLSHGVWDLPGPGIEPASPASAGRFLTTGPPGKSLSFTLNYSEYHLMEKGETGACIFPSVYQFSK